MGTPEALSSLPGSVPTSLIPDASRKTLAPWARPSRSSIQRRCLARDADERSFLDGRCGRGQAGGGRRAVASPPLGPQPQSGEKTRGLSVVWEARAR